MPAVSEETIRQRCALEPWVVQSRNHIKFGAAPEWFEGIAGQLPDGSPEREDYFKAAELAREVYRDQIRSAFNVASLADDAYVADLCRKEPWTTASGITDLSNGIFGYMTEKLEHARNRFHRDSEEHQAFDGAFEKAKIVYFDRIKEMAKNFASGKTRAEIENVNATLWAWSHRVEKSGTYLSARLVKLCEWNGVYFYQHGKQAQPDPTKQQFVVRPK